MNKQKFSNKIAVITATKDRPLELKLMLKSIELQSYKPDQIIIVDGGEQVVKRVVEEFPSLNIKYLRCTPPSVAKQRNIGINAVDLKINLIGFLDDDVVLEEKAFEEMMVFWERASKKIGLASFNLLNPPPLFAPRLKLSKIAKRLGFYSNGIGAILPSGFQTMIRPVSKNTFADYLPSTALICRRNIVMKIKLDEWFKGYDYIGDLDFSYKIGKIYKLVIVANAPYYHHPTNSGKGGGINFGIKEVISRIHIVKKYQEFSLLKCYLSLIIRMLISFYLAISEKRFYYFQRAIGNIIGFIKVIFKGNYIHKAG